MSIVIHLEECEPDGKGWTQDAYGSALGQGGQLCEQARYMASELYNDEPVWVEQDSTPEWVRCVEQAEHMERQAAILRIRANGLRCTQRESGGYRCTRDALPADHWHAVDEQWMDNR